MPILWRLICPYISLTGPPYRLSRSKALDKKGTLNSTEWQRVLEYFKRMGAQGVLVLMDADDLCPKMFGPHIRSQLDGLATQHGLYLGFCLAQPEYEAWFLVAADLLNLGNPIPETKLPRGCKEEIRNRTRYSPTIDQPRFTSKLTNHLEEVRKRSRSFDKLLREAERLCNLLR